MQEQLSSEDQGTVKATIMQKLDEHVVDFRSVSFTNFDGNFFSSEGPNILNILFTYITNPVRLVFDVLDMVFGGNTPATWVSNKHNANLYSHLISI